MRHVAGLPHATVRKQAGRGQRRGQPGSERERDHGRHRHRRPHLDDGFVPLIWTVPGAGSRTRTLTLALALSLLAAATITAAHDLRT
jgi:hypothetical protein